MILIKKFEFKNIVLLSIKYDGINDIYYLFDKFKILKIENDRDFWNDWE